MQQPAHGRKTRSFRPRYFLFGTVSRRESEAGVSQHPRLDRVRHTGCIPRYDGPKRVFPSHLVAWARVHGRFIPTWFCLLGISPSSPSSHPSCRLLMEL